MNSFLKFPDEDGIEKIIPKLFMLSEHYRRDGFNPFSRLADEFNKISIGQHSKNGGRDQLIGKLCSIIEENIVQFVANKM